MAPLSQDPMVSGAFVYAVATADVVRLLRLRKRLQRSLSFVYAGMYPTAATSEVLLCSQYCVNERKLHKIFCYILVSTLSRCTGCLKNSILKNYFIKVRNEKGGEQLFQIDPTKLKVMQGARTATVVPGYKATSSPIYLEIGSENSEFNNISILPSSLLKNVVRTQPSTSPTLVMSEPTSPTIQGIDNRQAFYSIDLNTMMTTSGFPLATVSSSLSYPNPVDKEVSGATKENWTDAEIQLLLEQRLNMNDKFENPNSRKTPYWNLIVKAFEEKGYKVTKHDLVNKWKNLQVTYNRNAIFEEKKSVNPPEESLGSTFKPETLTLKDESADVTCQEDADVKENILQRGKKRKLPKKEKTQFQEKMLRLVEEKKSQSLKLKKEIWEDKKKIATSKIEAMNNLVVALKDLQKNRTT